MSTYDSAAHSISKAIAFVAIWGALLAIVAITLPYLAKGDGQAICLVVFLAGLAGVIGSGIVVTVW